MENSHRRLSIVAAALAAFTFVAACGEPPRPGTPPRHLVLVTVEGLRADHVTAYGYPRDTTLTRKEEVTTPHDLDSLIDSGVRFENAFAPTGRWRATAASLMTGRSPRVHGVLGDDASLESSLPTLAERFQAEGFATAAFLSSRQSLVGSGVERGFDTFAEVESDAEVVKQVVKWLQGRVEAGGSHFLWLHLSIAPPFAGAALEDRFSEQDYTGPLTGETDFLADWASGAIEDNPINRARLIDLYDGRVRDAAALLDAFFWYYHRGIEDAGRWDGTVFVIAGTSGMELAERQEPNGPIGSTRSLHDAGLRVPLALRHPQSLTGERILAEVVELADVAPTVGEWFHLPDDPGATGRSLLALTDSYIERDFPSHPALALDLEDEEVRGRSLRSGKWRLLIANGAPELYRVDTDPRALHDVASRHPRVVDEMTAELRALESALADL